MFIILTHLSQDAHTQIEYVNRAEDFGMDHIDNITRSGGISFYDFNDDGFDDLTVATANGDSILFYESTGCGFRAITPLVSDFNDVKQILWVDIDNDGDPDFFYTTKSHGVRLYENTGNLNLIDITTSAGLDTSNHDSYGANFADFDRDGDLDLYLSTLVIATNVSNRLYRNDGNFNFTDVTTALGLRDTFSYSFVSGFVDINNDLWPDIIATTDKVLFQNKLYLNDSAKVFHDISFSSGTNDSIEAMSVTVEDYDYDGDLDIYITNTYLGNYFLQNNGDSTFSNIAPSNGTAMNSWCWGAVFLDADNDSDLDLYVSSQEDGNTHAASSFFRKSAGNYVNVKVTGMEADTVNSHASAIGDFNNDGKVDIAVKNLDVPISLWENNSMTGNYAKFELIGTISNADAIGSMVHIYHNGSYQNRYLMCGEGFLGQNSATEHLGLGADTIIDSLLITWPSGLESKVFQLPVNELIQIVEPSTISDPLTLVIIGDKSPCSGEIVQIHAIGDFDQYNWNTGDTTSSVLVDTARVYSVTASKPGINRTASFEIDYRLPASLDLGNDTSICEGSTLKIELDQFDCHSWSDMSNESYLEINEAGSYWVEISDHGCFSSDTINVLVNEIEEFDLGEDTIICAGDSIEIGVTGEWESYEWSDNSKDSSVIVSQSGTYRVIAADSNACQYSDQIQVFVEDCLGMLESFENYEIRVYPNPASNEIHIDSEKLEIVNVKILNSSNQEVVSSSANGQSVELSLNDLSPGLYCLQIQTSSKTEFRKIIVNR